MNEEERKTFKRIFRSYYDWVANCNDSLLARIYGVYTVKIEKLDKVHLILMGNSMQLQKIPRPLNGEKPKKTIKYVFDLKGSMVNWETKNPKEGSTLKDINLLNIKIDQNILKFSPFDSSNIVNLLKDDSSILRDGNVMDYSMLLAIEENVLYRPPGIDSTNVSAEKMKEEDEFFKNRHRFISSNRQYIYHISVIDYLQDYNIDKRFENLAKTILKGNKAEISAVPPKRY